MERFEITLNGDRGALPRVVAWATSRRWTILGLEFRRGDSPDRRSLMLELDVGNRRELVSRQLARLIDVLAVH